MAKIHLKRSVHNRETLCGIVPDKDRLTTADLVTSLKSDVICKVCLKMVQMSGLTDKLKGQKPC